MSKYLEHSGFGIYNDSESALYQYLSDKIYPIKESLKALPADDIPLRKWYLEDAIARRKRSIDEIYERMPIAKKEQLRLALDGVLRDKKPMDDGCFQQVIAPLGKTVADISRPVTDRESASIHALWTEYQHLQLENESLRLTETLKEAPGSVKEDNLREKFPILWDRLKKVEMIEEAVDYHGFYILKHVPWIEQLADIEKILASTTPNNTDRTMTAVDFEKKVAAMSNVEKVTYFLTKHPLYSLAKEFATANNNGNTPDELGRAVEEIFKDLYFDASVAKAFGRLATAEAVAPEKGVAFIGQELEKVYERDRQRIIGEDDKNPHLLLRQRRQEARAAIRKQLRDSGVDPHYIAMLEDRAERDTKLPAFS